MRASTGWLENSRIAGRRTYAPQGTKLVAEYREKGGIPQKISGTTL
jgi:hypothetical protein